MLPGVSVEFASCPSFSTSGVDVRTGVGALFRREGATFAAAGTSISIGSITGARVATGAGRLSERGSGDRGAGVDGRGGGAAGVGATAGGAACTGGARASIGMIGASPTGGVAGRTATARISCTRPSSLPTVARSAPSVAMPSSQRCITSRACSSVNSPQSGLVGVQCGDSLGERSRGRLQLGRTTSELVEHLG